MEMPSELNKKIDSADLDFTTSESKMESLKQQIISINRRIVIAENANDTGGVELLRKEKRALEKTLSIIEDEESETSEMNPVIGNEALLADRLDAIERRTL